MSPLRKLSWVAAPAAIATLGLAGMSAVAGAARSADQARKGNGSTCAAGTPGPSAPPVSARSGLDAVRVHPPAHVAASGGCAPGGPSPAH